MIVNSIECCCFICINITIIVNEVVFLMYSFLDVIDEKTFNSIDTVRYPMKEVILHELLNEQNASVVSMIIIFS